MIKISYWSWNSKKGMVIITWERHLSLTAQDWNLLCLSKTYKRETFVKRNQFFLYKKKSFLFVIPDQYIKYLIQIILQAHIPLVVGLEVIIWLHWLW